MYKQSPILQLQDISVQFGYTEALKSINLDLYAGEIVGIVGENGVGKSTLIKIISGFIKPTQGSIIFHGKEVKINSIRDATDLGIATVFQGQEFCDNLDVTSNLFLGKEIRNQRNHTLDNVTMACKAREALHELTSAIRVHTPIRSLSTGQRQTIALARILLTDPQLILLDEPTTSLSLTQTAETLSYIQRLRSQGRTILMVCHDLPDVFAIATRILVLRQGRIVGDHNISETNYVQIVKEMAGVNDDSDSQAVTQDSQHRYSALHRQHKLIDRRNNIDSSDIKENNKTTVNTTN